MKRTSQVLSSRRKVQDRGDAELGEVGLVTDTRKLQDLRGVDGTSRKDYLLTRGDGDTRSCVSRIESKPCTYLARITYQKS